MRIHFVLISEGSSDNGLVDHLERLCIAYGAEEATGSPLDFRRLPTVERTVAGKLRAAIQLEPNANLIFIHRDADSRDATRRYAEISEAVEDCALLTEWVAVVPVQETEAWLLLDEAAIRSVAGKPHGRTELSLPRPRMVETIASPKEYLQNLIVTASGLTGRRLNELRRSFPGHRQMLLRRLPIEGSIQHVPSWVRMRDELIQALKNLRALEQRQ